eukprot:gene7378-888_t
MGGAWVFVRSDGWTAEGARALNTRAVGDGVAKTVLTRPRTRARARRCGESAD